MVLSKLIFEIDLCQDAAKIIKILTYSSLIISVCLGGHSLFCLGGHALGEPSIHVLFFLACNNIKELLELSFSYCFWDFFPTTLLSCRHVDVDTCLFVLSLLSVSLILATYVRHAMRI